MTGEAKPPGRIAGTLLRLFTRTATVRELRVLDERFRLVTLSGDSLRGVRWTPGQKVQILLGGWVNRTYTPLTWDAVDGSVQLLLFLHGEAPGAVWGRGLKVGDPCMIFGPRDSLDLDTLERPGLLFGDETSFGLAYALRHTPQGAADISMVFEVNSKAVAEAVLGHLGIISSTLVERRSGDSHLGEVEALITDPLRIRSTKSFALSGKASSIQRLNRRLRSLGLSSRQIRTRAYWAPGRTGLD